MDRPTFTPRTWYSKDGKWKFMMDKHGITDMIPVGQLRRWLDNYSPPRELDHIHWALPRD